METWEVREEKGGEWRTDRIQAGTALQPLAGRVVRWHLGHCPRGTAVPAFLLTSPGLQGAAG